MSNLTYLNDASVLYNLKQRYYHKLIYVSQGLSRLEFASVHDYLSHLKPGVDTLYTWDKIEIFRGKILAMITGAMSLKLFNYLYSRKLFIIQKSYSSQYSLSA